MQGSSKKYYDEIWFKKFKSIYSYKRAYFVNKNPEIEITQNSVRVINNLASRTNDEKEKLKYFLNKKQRKINKLRELISNLEENSFVKNKYLGKLNLAEIDTQIYQINLSSENQRIKQEKINELLLKKFPVFEKDLEIFTCEFIDFIKFLIQKFPENKELLELSNQNFYKVNYHETKIDFEKAWQKHNLQEVLIKNLETKRFGSKEVKIIIRKFIHKISLKKIRIRIEDRMLFSVEPILRRINIPQNLDMTGKRLVEIIAHEVCVHLYRSIQGYENLSRENFCFEFLGSSDTENLDIEEGLATYFDQNIFGESDKHDIFRLFQHYLSAIAVFLGRKFEPIVVYEKLQKIEKTILPILNPTKINDDNLALKRVKRLYLNFENPEFGFVNPKIALYLIGNRKIWKFIENKNNLINLFAGKVGINDLEDLEKMNFEIPTKYLKMEKIDFDLLREQILSCF